jgi:hypothetical protein
VLHHLGISFSSTVDILMLRPDEIDKIHHRLQNFMHSRYRREISYEGTEDIIKAINLAGYKLVKEEAPSQSSDYKGEPG